MSGIFRFAALSHDQLRVMRWNRCGMGADPYPKGMG